MNPLEAIRNQPSLSMGVLTKKKRNNNNKINKKRREKGRENEREKELIAFSLHNEDLDQLQGFL